MDIPRDKPTELGRLVKQQRKDAGLSIDDLEAVTGINRATINRIELGRITAPSPQKLQRLAQALGTEVEDYFALAGYFTTHGLPNVGPYLRAKYDVTPELAAEAETYFTWLRERSRQRDTDDQRAA